MKRFCVANVRWSTAATCLASLLVFASALRADQVVWGTGDPIDGILDATRIPTTSVPAGTLFQDVNRGFDLTVVTSSLNQDGLGTFVDNTQSQSTWWFEGGTRSNTNQSINYSTVEFHFYAPNTTTPLAVTGLHFTLQDAEVEERFRNLIFLNAAGQAVPISYSNSSIITYSTGKPGVHASDGSFDSGAKYEGGTQADKWIDINLSNTPITGFKFQTGRSLSSYGSVEMTGLGNLMPYIDAASGVAIAAGRSYEGLRAVSTTSAHTVAQILGGVASSSRTVTMNFTSGAPFQTSPTTDPSNNDTLSISGTNGDKFVLQLSYDPSTLAFGTNESVLYLSWYNPATMALDLANAGNTDLPGEANDIANPEIQGAYDPTTDFHLGYYGVDTVNHTVWAVIDHNSDFTVVAAPEPTSAALAACGALPLLARRRRRATASA